jgi:hypothetical protein
MLRRKKHSQVVPLYEGSSPQAAQTSKQWMLKAAKVSYQLTPDQDISDRQPMLRVVQVMWLTHANDPQGYLGGGDRGGLSMRTGATNSLLRQPGTPTQDGPAQDRRVKDLIAGASGNI